MDKRTIKPPDTNGVPSHIHGPSDATHFILGFILLIRRNNLPPLNDFRTLTGPVYVPEFFNNLPAPWTLHQSGSR